MKKTDEQLLAEAFIKIWEISEEFLTDHEGMLLPFEGEVIAKIYKLTSNNIFTAQKVANGDQKD
jgi:hypothetical protein